MDQCKDKVQDLVSTTGIGHRTRDVDQDLRPKRMQKRGKSSYQDETCECRCVWWIHEFDIFSQNNESMNLTHFHRTMNPWIWHIFKEQTYRFPLLGLSALKLQFWRKGMSHPGFYLARNHLRDLSKDTHRQFTYKINHIFLFLHLKIINIILLVFLLIIIIIISINYNTFFLLWRYVHCANGHNSCCWRERKHFIVSPVNQCDEPLSLEHILLFCSDLTDSDMRWKYFNVDSLFKEVSSDIIFNFLKWNWKVKEINIFYKL